MMQLLVAHMKLKMIHKLIQKFDPCMNRQDEKVIMYRELRETAYTVN